MLHHNNKFTSGCTILGVLPVHCHVIPFSFSQAVLLLHAMKPCQDISTLSYLDDKSAFATVEVLDTHRYDRSTNSSLVCILHASEQSI